MPIDGVFPLAPTFDHAGPMARDVTGCIELMRDLVNLEVPDVVLSDLRVARAWSDDATIEFPTAEGISVAFMHEVGRVHRELYAEHSDLYGENIRGKIERCLAVTESEYETALLERGRHAERAMAALDGYDLLITPVLSVPVPPADVVEVEIRGALTLYTFPFNALGWPALAVGGTQIVGRPGSDGLVLAAGLALEALKA